MDGPIEPEELEMLYRGALPIACQVLWKDLAFH